MKYLIKYFCYSIHTAKCKFINAMILSLLTTAINISVIAISQNLLSSLVSLSINEMLLRLALVLILLLLSAFTEAIWYKSLDSYGGAVINALLKDAEAALDMKPMNEIDALKQEKIKHILYADALDIFRIIGHHLPLLCSSLLLVCGAVCIAFQLSSQNTLYLCIAFVSGILIAFVSEKKINAVSRKTNTAMKQLHASLDTIVDHLPYAKTNQWLLHDQQMSETAVNVFIDTASKEDATVTFWNKVIDNYNTLINIVVSALLILPMQQNNPTDVAFYMFLLYILLQKGQSVEKLILQIAKGRVSFENYEALIHTNYINGTESLSSIETVDFENVTFAYDTKDVLNNFTHVFHHGEFLQLIGNNGTGKTTLFKLMQRLYQPQSGTILLNGIDLNAFQKEKLADQFLYIGQNEPLLNGTIINYLCSFDSSLKEEQLTELQKLLDLPSLDSTIENNGQNLSGGQIKKLLLAKLMIRKQKASVILIDEIDAGMDLETKQQYKEILTSIARERRHLIMYISHDASLVVPTSRQFHL